MYFKILQVSMFLEQGCPTRGSADTIVRLLRITREVLILWVFAANTNNERAVNVKDSGRHVALGVRGLSRVSIHFSGRLV